MKNKVLTFCFLLISTFVFTQEKTSWSDEHLYFKGYIKDLRIINFVPNAGIIQDNFIHNRLNFKYYINQKWTFAAEARNRLFYGESVKLNSSYASSVHIDHGLFSTSVLWIDESSLFLHSIVDRVYVDFQSNKWGVRVGRQRINWGISSVWNPNDLFNAFNFANFDYEERPGSDGIRIQRYLKDGMSSYEVAAKLDTGKNNQVIAARYIFNKWNYDIQILGGVYFTDVALGVGFAGNLKNAGLKGETTYFQDKLSLSKPGVLNATLGLDYTLRKGMSSGVSLLYNSQGFKDLSSLTSPSLLSFAVSPKNLMPSEWSIMGQLGYPLSPIISTSLAVIYAPQLDLFFLMPSVSTSISGNWELMVLGQSYFADAGSGVIHAGTGLFIRTKFSF